MTKVARVLFQWWMVVLVCPGAVYYHPTWALVQEASSQPPPRRPAVVRISRDLQGIGRLRYHIYEHESKRPDADPYLKELFQKKSNHEDQTVVLDDNDFAGVHFVLVEEEQQRQQQQESAPPPATPSLLTGCLRLNFGSLEKSLGPELTNLMEIKNILLPDQLAGIAQQQHDHDDDHRTLFVSRLAIAPGKRGTLFTMKLCAVAFSCPPTTGLSVGYAVTTAKLGLLYQKMGFVVVAEKELD
eukprot:CAMPEP_0168788336 /NCGR_PEP_ID=MMETSP0725-20121227/12280_1 /TAXON_ID=265536 /ORGANISM="Amphiprora sp., Strain CCMP467" /LENGTH=241 /DNA_ID=CAMNT_0008838603 /DNA_START=18 /DNA_END=741 /DNA_ORIENTATION=-